MTHNSISTISGTPRTNGRSLSRRQDCKSWSARRSSADRRSHSMDASHAKTWDAIYAKHGGRHWPCEPLVSFVRRVYGPLPPEVRRGLRAVELGSGIGNNLWFLLDEGFQVAGIEPSTEARRLCVEYLMLRQAGGYALESRPWPPWRREFDLVVDVTTLQHLSERNHRAALEWIQNVLVPGHRLFSLP